MAQETLEEAAIRYEETDFNTTPTEETSQMMIQRAFINGAKWQAERMYSEALEFGRWIIQNPDFQNTSSWSLETAKFNFEQFKKKA